MKHLLYILKEFRLRETGNLKHLYRSELDEASFAFDAAYSDCTDLTELFQMRFWKIELINLLEIVDMMDIKEHWQVWSITFLIRKQGQE